MIKKRYLFEITLIFSLFFVIFSPVFAETVDDQCFVRFMDDSKEKEGCEKYWTGNFNMFLGAKMLNKEDWEPIDEHYNVGLEYDFRRNDWPINVTIDVLYSFEDDTISVPVDEYIYIYEIKGKTIEFQIGSRKIWQPTKRMRPFIGGGLSLIRAKAEGRFLGESLSDKDVGIGYWAGIGIYWTFEESFNIGIECIHSRSEVELFGVDTESGGEHYGLIIGYHWKQFPDYF